MKKSIFFFLTLLMVLGIYIPATANISFLWTMEEKDEVAKFDSDHTGASFAINSEKVRQGKHSVEIIPSGINNETKLALPLAGKKLEKWINNQEVFINVYLPEKNSTNPTGYFLGIADITDQWKWVDGVFADTHVKPGWNRIKFHLTRKMYKLKEDCKYKLYFSFIGYQGGEKIPLKESFYIDGIFLQEKNKEKIKATGLEVEKILSLEDDELLEVVERKTFDYFWYEANPKNGLIKDRSTPNSPCSIAAVGFGLSAIPLGVERGWITKDEGFQRALITLKTFANGGVEGKKGFYYHFVDMNHGKRVYKSELSSIDTAIFLAGAITVGEYFQGTKIEELANILYKRADWKWMMNGSKYLCMGWKPESGFLESYWDSFNEGLLAYVLAIGSPTHSVPVESWDAIYRPIKFNFISLPSEPLFVYQYPLIWLDLRNKEDNYANYYNNAVYATKLNHYFAKMKRNRYQTYDDYVWGISASDGPEGYRAYGASEGNHDGTVAPYASIASIPFTPELSIKTMRTMLKKYGKYIWRDYGFVSAFNVDKDWYSRECIGIDQGDILLMIENYRSGLIWKLFMGNKYVKNAIDKIGFQDKKSEYAVKPEYKKTYFHSK